MGAQFGHVAFHAEAPETLAFLDRNEIELWAADAGGTAINRSDAPSRLAIALGNEGAGLSPEIRANAARTVSLPISASVESLNVAVAAGIILYELR
jgi:tRNA G18 (ribose-2'-O)-methylase SpoU